MLQEMQYKPLKDKVWHNIEAELPRLEGERSQRAARGSQAATAVGFDGFHTRSPLTCDAIDEYLDYAELCGFVATTILHSLVLDTHEHYK